MRFNNYIEFINYLKKKEISFIGKGNEGISYRGKDGLAYKIYTKARDLDISEIILDGDYYLDSFAFPKELFYVRNNVAGYTSKYIENNLFDESKINKNILKINFNILKEAYNIFLEDLTLISSSNIILADLPPNLLFNGKKLYAIDTNTYQEMYDPYEENKIMFDEGIKSKFRNWYKRRNNKDIENLEVFDYLKEIEQEQQKVLTK